MSEPVLKIQDLSVSFFDRAGEAKALSGVSFDLEKGQILGIVGESGSGKSVTMQAILQILNSEGRITGGKILFKGEDMSLWSPQKVRAFRGKGCAMIFQDPMTSLNPLLTIGKQITEAVTLHTGKRGREAYQRAVELLTLVGMNDPERRMKQYPHELSGGRRQRIMIAMALASEPDILIADEPTTALDVTVQAQILELILEIRNKLGMAVIIVSHNLGIIAEVCDEVLVLYGGSVCEKGTVQDIFYHPRHEYTKGLLASIPNGQSRDRLKPIGGSPVNVRHLPAGCAFCPRCEEALKICLTDKPQTLEVSPGHIATCWRNDPEYRQYLENMGKEAHHD